MSVLEEISDIFPWNENFTTGIDIIDLQHQKLVDLVNLLANHLAYQSDAPTLSTIFDELTAYAAYHFETEENVWRAHCEGDPATETHLSAHKQFIEQVMNLKEANQGQDFSRVIEEVLSFLTHWLAFHILDNDRRMAITVRGLQAGLPIDAAKLKAESEMMGAMHVLIKTILSMYDTLSKRTINLMKEINKRQRLEKKLNLAANVIQNTLDGICVTDAELRIVETNPAFCQSCGLNEADINGQALKGYKSGLADATLFAAINRAIDEKGHWSGEVKSRNQSGALESEWLTISSMTDDDGDVCNYIAVFSNVSQLLKRQQSLEQAANHDALTGLPNRMLLTDRLTLAITRSERNASLLAVCYLDLDGFKPVNDQFGHAAGDQLLCQIASRYQHVLRENDTVARFGGDEFVILLENLASAEDCEALLTRLLHEVSQPIVIDQLSITVTASIGIALFPAHANSAGQLIHLADQAMFKAKNAGKSRFHFAEAHSDSRPSSNMVIES